MARACLRSRQAAAEGLGRGQGNWKNVQRGRKQSYGDMEREWFTLLNAATRSRTRRPGRWPREPWNSGWSRTCREAVCRARAWLGVLKGGRDRGGNRWLPVPVAAPRHHRRGRQGGRRKVMGLEHALHLLLVHLLQLLELRQVLLAKAHEARGGGGRWSRRARIPRPGRGLRKRHRRWRRDRRRRIVAAPAISAPIRVHIGEVSARLVPAPLLAATDL